MWESSTNNVLQSHSLKEKVRRVDQEKGQEKQRGGGTGECAVSEEGSEHG